MRDLAEEKLNKKKYASWANICFFFHVHYLFCFNFFFFSRKFYILVWRYVLFQFNTHAVFHTVSFLCIRQIFNFTVVYWLILAIGCYSTIYFIRQHFPLKVHLSVCICDSRFFCCFRTFRSFDLIHVVSLFLNVFFFSTIPADNKVNCNDNN